MDNPTPENHIFNFNDNDWEHIQTRSSSSSDDHLSVVFPPSLHQDLTIINSDTATLPLSTPHHYTDQETPISPSPSQSAISSQPSEPEPKAWILSLICRRLGLRLSSKVANLAAKTYSLVSLWKAGIFTALMFTFIWINSRRRRRRRVPEEDASKLRKLIKEKDRVIDKLLLEIANMNEELSVRRSVPVYRVR